MHVWFARLTVAALVYSGIWGVCGIARAESIEIDLREAIARARRAAPEGIVARGKIAEAEAGATGAALAFTQNPELEVGAGPRLRSGGVVDAEARIEQALELGQRGPRRQRAAAELRHARAEVDDAMRALDREVSLAFAEAAFADAEAALAARAEELAQRASQAADRRRTAGEVVDLDANLARAALGRARAARHTAAADRATAIGRLAAQIGAAPDDAIALRGGLQEVAQAPALAARADLRALDASRAVAEASRAVADASARPEVALWAAYQREDTTSIVLGGLRLTLPLWNRAQGERAAADAQARSAREAHAATLRAASREVHDAELAYAEARAAVDAFERDVVPVLDDSERLLQRTIDAGQLAVSDFLVARQELLSGRREYLERQLAVARAAAYLRFVAGVSL